MSQSKKSKSRLAKVKSAVEAWQADPSPRNSDNVIIQMAPFIDRAVLRLYAVTSSGYADAEDLRQEVSLGVYRALFKFDGRIPFPAYASYYMRLYVQRYLLKASLVNYGRGPWHQKLKTSYYRRVHALKSIDSSLTLAEIHKLIAEDLGCDVGYVDRIKAEKTGISSLNIEFDDPPNSNQQGKACSPMQILSDNPEYENLCNRDLDKKKIFGFIRETFSDLNPLKKDVLENRLLTDCKHIMADIADRHGVTRQAVDQHEKALKRKIVDACQAHFFKDLT